MSITDINEHRWKRHCTPVAVVDGVEWYEFGVSYTVDGLEFGGQVRATDFEDAKRRLKLMADGKVSGVLHSVHHTRK